MAITSTDPLTTERRTTRVQVNIPRGQAPEVVFTRQITSRLPDGTVLRDKTEDSVRRVIDGPLLAEAVEVNGKTLTVLDVMSAVSAFGDKWDAEELAKPKP